MAMLLKVSWNDAREMKLLDNDDGWDTDTDYGDADTWYPDLVPHMEDQAKRERRIEYIKHFIETKGFDIDKNSPFPGEVVLVDLWDRMPFERVQICASFAIEVYNQTMGKNLMLVEIVKAVAWRITRLLITLRVIDKVTLEMGTYQTRVLRATPFWDDKIKSLEIFKPCPVKKEESPIRNRLKLDKRGTKKQYEAVDATYAACSCCEEEKYDLISAHARKFKVKFSLRLGPIGLYDPFHRCRIKQSAEVFLVRYSEYKNEKYVFKTVLEARLNTFSRNQLHYDITFMAYGIRNPVWKRARSIKFHIQVHYNNIRHGENIEFKMEDAEAIEIIDD